MLVTPLRSTPRQRATLAAISDVAAARSGTFFARIVAVPRARTRRGPRSRVPIQACALRTQSSRADETKKCVTSFCWLVSCFLLLPRAARQPGFVSKPAAFASLRSRQPLTVRSCLAQCPASGSLRPIVRRAAPPGPVSQRPPEPLKSRHHGSERERSRTLPMGSTILGYGRRSRPCAPDTADPLIRASIPPCPRGAWGG